MLVDKLREVDETEDHNLTEHEQWYTVTIHFMMLFQFGLQRLYLV